MKEILNRTTKTSEKRFKEYKKLGLASVEDIVIDGKERKVIVFNLNESNHIPHLTRTPMPVGPSRRNNFRKLPLSDEE